jgi:enoyl-CoA hydratase/carnithine racemase
VTSTLIHGGVPLKKVQLMQLVGENVTGEEADRWGIISKALPAGELVAYVTEVAKAIADRHLAPLEHSKITVQMGRDLSLSQAIQLDQLVGARLRRVMDPTEYNEEYLKSQKGGPNLAFKRPDA